MNAEAKDTAQKTNRIHEQRGAALLTVLMLSTLLLTMCGVLILMTGMTARTAIDSTSEMQAYYSAEAGVQECLNVLRGNIAPNAAMPAGTQINFRNAVKSSTSNLPTDAASAFPCGNCRLSGWLNYNYPSAAADRVALTSSYAPQTGLAFSVLVSDPDQIPEASGPPYRLLFHVTGYGPKGSIKNLEVIVNSSSFNYNAPATIMMRGADDCSALNFNIGDSNAKDYSGLDHAVPSTGTLPAFGATCAGNETNEQTAITKGPTVANPQTQTFGNSALPPWLQSADSARAFLADQKANATYLGRYFSSFSGYSGSDAAPAFTFVDGDCTLSGGAGLLIVTGNLTLNGTPNFDGLVLVLGAGSVTRNGAGNGNIYGAMSVAKFDAVGPGGFLAPTFDTSGGGNSTMQYDSSWVRKALDMSGPRAQGIHEY